MRTCIAHYMCGHRAVFKDALPEVADRVYCVKCDRGTDVRMITDEIRAKCHECGYNHGFGDDGTKAEQDAAKHAERQSHVVGIYLGSQVRMIVNSDGSHYTIP